MKKCISLTILILFTLASFATNRYFSGTGNDASGNGTQGNPYKSIAKFNSSSASFTAGDSILFESGSTFYGTIVPTKAFIFATYGGSVKAIISGFTALVGWTNDGSGIWHINVPNAKNSLNTVAIDDNLQRIGRTPNFDATNSGYRQYTSLNSATPSITDPTLPNSPSYVGAEVVIRKQHWILDRCPVTAQSGGTISYTNPSTYFGKTGGYGYFFQNALITLDQFGEWFLNKSTKNLSVYFGSNNPASYDIKCSTLDTLINLGSLSNCTIANLAFEGANLCAISGRNGTNITIKNCTINNVNGGIWVKATNNLAITNTTISNCLDIGIDASVVGNYVAIIRYDTLRNIGMFAGMGGSADSHYEGIQALGHGSFVEYNTLDSVGYNPIVFRANNIKIRYNHIRNYCFVKDDGGGIYTSGVAGTVTYSGEEITSNVIYNAIGAPNGTQNTSSPGSTYDAHGVYMDEGSNNILTFFNSCYNMNQGAGYFSNFGQALTIKYNTSYNTRLGFRFDRPAHSPSYPPSRNLRWIGNISYVNVSDIIYQNGELNTPTPTNIVSDIRAVFPAGGIDSNYYRNNLTYTFYWPYHVSNGGNFVNPPPVQLVRWKDTVNQEAHSVAMSTAPTLFLSNPYDVNSTQSLGLYQYQDVYGNTYNGNTTLAPHTTLLLFRGLANPIAMAGNDTTIILPTSSATLHGSGTDFDGTIVSYGWTQIAGAGTTITPNNAPTTTISGMSTIGTYDFVLTVTDNDGLTDKDTVRITVIAANNTPPTANAGPDKSITLPTTTSSASGSGTNGSGTSRTYSWSQISGPSLATIATPSSASTNLTNLTTAGTYTFRLKVTNNLGDTAVDFMQVVVNPANVAPTANAGVDQSVTLPTTTATLTGSGTDPDGTITGYAWIKVSGPTGGNITSPSSATTGITALQQGTYVYQLTVTDNDGATGSDLMQIVVNAANINPTANAGIDQSITLPTSTTTLVGSGSDPDGSIVSYAWVKISGPVGGTITSASSATTGITALQQGSYVFQLTVTDNGGLTGSDFVQVVVNAANINPTANAGVDQSITLPTNTTTLVGSGTDPDGTIVAYAWLKISGPVGGTITSPANSTTGITALQQGTYVFRLTVTDNGGLTGQDFVQVVVNPAVVPPNLPPVAVAGADQNITLPTSSVTVNGSGSSDPDGTIVAYLWTKISGPSTYTITTSTNVSTTITSLVAGTYIFQLRVTDNSGDTATDALQVTVNPANLRPVVNAGSNQTITLPTSTVTLTGTATDPDGTITATLWTKISGPSGGAITSPTSLTTGITGLIQGTYVYQLRATDNSGDTASAAVQITVNAANVAPTANAGSNQTITLPTSTTTLTGSGTDPDGTIVGYLWRKTSGPTGGTITSSTSATTGITALQQGVYTYQLRVTDNSGDTGVASVQVTVLAANLLPNALAGNDTTITLPTNSVNLNGSASNDPDGTITAYKWIQLSGPSLVIIINSTSAIATVNGMIQGAYVFQLKVTGSAGSSDTAVDAIQITVINNPNQIPTADADTNRTIQLPVDSTILEGSGTDLDGTIVSYHWSFVSGPSINNIVDIDSATTTIRNLIAGIYTFRLTVRDDSGATGTDTVQVTVLAAPISNRSYLLRWRK